MKYWAFKSEIQLKEFGIPLKMESRIEVPLKKKKKQESSTWNLESKAWSPESRLSLIEKKKRHVSSLKSVAHVLSGGVGITFRSFVDHLIKYYQVCKHDR